MYNNMDTYDKNKLCPKCGETGASTKHYAESTTIDLLRLTLPERMGRTCQNCKYEWFEKPLDAEQG